MMDDDGFWVWEWVKILKDRPQIGMASFSFSITVTICSFCKPPSRWFHNVKDAMLSESGAALALYLNLIHSHVEKMNRNSGGILLGELGMFSGQAQAAVEDE